MVLRVLVCAACVAIIAAVGFWFYDRHLAAQAAEAVARQTRCDRHHRDYAAALAGRATSDGQSKNVYEVLSEVCRLDGYFPRN